MTQMNVPPALDDAPALDFVAVTKRYGDTVAVAAFDLQVRTGQFVALLGPSGCGKSTLLRMLAGLEEISEGEIYIRGKLVNYVPPKARDVAMVFQNYALYPHMTVADNIGFPLKMGRSSKKSIRPRVEEVARLLDLDRHLHRYPEQLSGGQRQRVALGRAIIRDPVAFLMDEPLSNLDALLRVQMREELLEFHRRVGKTTMYVTHDQVEAMSMADRVVVMCDGVVRQVGTPREVYGRPCDTFVAKFVGSPQMNFFDGRIERSTFIGHGLSLPVGDASAAGMSDGIEVTLGVRPEDITLGSPGDGEAPAGIVHLLEFVGADLYVHVALAEGVACMVRASSADDVSEGDHVALRLSDRALHLFGPDGRRLGAEGAPVALVANRAS
jgi:multiple sugar transport system ATP-binding protein